MTLANDANSNLRNI